MPKVPRDLSGRDLAKLLGRYGYDMTRQTGSHIRLISSLKGSEHRITIPDHVPVKIGTLNAILVEVSTYLKISKHELVDQLFSQ